ncbi:MAG: hypothetical protein IT203_09130 [Fimbriimonadaceae bacterium]|nr:hypothetical protein [Fimbriimonadaceae bacterium]
MGDCTAEFLISGDYYGFVRGVLDSVLEERTGDNGVLKCFDVPYGPTGSQKAIFSPFEALEKAALVRH